MKILLNLAPYTRAFELISQNREAVGLDVVSRVCKDFGIPLPMGNFDKDQSINHTAVYELVSEELGDQLVSIPTPDFANLVGLGNLNYQLTLHNRK